MQMSDRFSVSAEVVAGAVDRVQARQTGAALVLDDRIWQDAPREQIEADLMALAAQLREQELIVAEVA